MRRIFSGGGSSARAILFAFVAAICLLYGLLVAIQRREQRIAHEQERSTGLGAVASAWVPPLPWNRQSSPAASWSHNSAAYYEFNTEEYSVISESGFRDAQASPLSTFSIDVDTASYSRVRRFLSDGQPPPAAAVRVEELINYFSYDYPEPAEGHPLSVTTEMARCPWEPHHHLVRIGLGTRSISLSRAPPSNLVFLIDVSGSMESPDKLPLLKQAFTLLVDQLRSQDRVAIVVYAGAAGLVLDSTPGSDKASIRDALDQLEAGGSTAGGEGIKLAYEAARENFLKNGNNRVILATDGDFNVGVSSDAELIRLIEQERRSGVFLTVLGFGTGNFKDSKMEKIADNGNGAYAYIDSIMEARRVLVEQVGATLLTVAKDVKVQVEFNPAIVQGYRLIGYENRLLAAEDFNNDAKDAGELGAGHKVTAIYEIVAAGSESGANQVDELKYQRNVNTRDGRKSGEALTIKIRYKPPQAEESRLLSRVVKFQDGSFNRVSEDFRFAAAVAEFGMLLSDSPHKGQASFEQVLTLAEGSEARQRDGSRSEFSSLVRDARRLSSR